MKITYTADRTERAATEASDRWTFAIIVFVLVVALLSDRLATTIVGVVVAAALILDWALETASRRIAAAIMAPRHHTHIHNVRE